MCRPKFDSTASFNRADKFSNRFSTYLTLLAYSLGMADIWRFPFLAFRNGGGAFLIPFVTMVLITGIPLYFLEYSLGKFSGRGPYRVWDISPLFRGIGVTVSLAYGLYLAGSSIFRCWLLEFIFFVFRDPLPWNFCNNTWNTIHCLSNQAIVSQANNIVLTYEPSYSSLSPVSNYTYMPDSNLANLTVTPSINSSSGSTAKPMSAVEEFWQYQILQLSSGISDFTPVLWRYVLFMFVVRLAIFLCNLKSIKTIEKVVYVTGLLPFLMIVAIFIRSLMLPGCKDGIYYFFYPQYHKLLSARVWIEATLMAFYTLGFGWGAVLLMGSHADFKDNSIRTAILVPLVDMTLAIFGGLVCFAVLGNMAYTFQIHVRDVINAGFATGMVAYVTALSSLPVPQIWSGLFLVSVLLTGVDAQMIPIDMIMQLIGDLFPRTRAGFRIYALAALSAAIFILSLLTCTGSGAYVFLWVDWYGGTWVGPIVAFIEILVTAWIYGMDRFDEDVYMMIGRRVPAVLRVGIAFVSPIIVLIIFFTSIVEYVPPRYGSYSYPTITRVLGWLMVTLTMLPIFIHAALVLRQAEGSLAKRIKTLIKPLETWGPCEEDKRNYFEDSKTKYKNRTFKDLLLYNALGKYPLDSEMMQASSQEMFCLRS